MHEEHARNYRGAMTSTQSGQTIRSIDSEFEALTRELAEKELELATLENQLANFEKRYAKSVGILFAEIDFLEAEIAKEMLRLHPEDPCREGFRRAEQKAKRSKEAVNEWSEPQKKPAYVPNEEIRNLYRKVAKTIHPDLADNEDERAFRTLLMTRANAAYKIGDKQALEQILYEWEHRDKQPVTGELEPSQPDLLERKILQIKARLNEIEINIRKLKESELYQLMVKVERADKEKRDLLGDMAKDLQEKIASATRLLVSLREQERG
jgi:hypothetical protein